MEDEFPEEKQNVISSDAGFTVELKFGGGLTFRDGRGEIAVDTEWLVDPPRMLIYQNRLAKLGRDRAADVLAKIVRALRYKGIESEIDDWM